MGRLVLAFKVFFAVLLNRDAAEAVAGALRGGGGAAEPGKLAAGGPLESSSRAEATARPEPPPAPTRPPRSEALTLLATLQREARFVDLVQESLGEYSDEQIGAAARDVLRDCRRVLDRLFRLESVVEGEEGQSVEVPAGYDPGEYQLTGNVGGGGPGEGTLVHHGWRAAKCELPEWQGSPRSARIVAAAEVEFK